MTKKENETALTQPMIENKIFNIKDTPVMIDRDLAELYQVETRVLIQAVKRNRSRFPGDFIFQLNKSEFSSWKSQNVMSNADKMGLRRPPYAFTEQGVAMLSAVLRSEVAVQVSIQIMQAFVKMRKFLMNNASVFQRLDNLELKQLKTDEKLEQIFKALESKHLKPDKGIFFNGQVFDAWVFISDLVKSAKNSLIIIDNYVDETVLALFAKKKKDVSVSIYTKTISRALQEDAKKFNTQFGQLSLHTFDASHDRFLLIDGSEVYHIGASLKDLGKKWFAFSKMEKDSLVIFEKLGI